MLALGNQPAGFADPVPAGAAQRDDPAHRHDQTVGLIKLPGAMTGMILAGASPLEAVQLQLIVMYMLVGAVTFTGLIAAYLTYRAFFTGAHQLKPLRPLPDAG